MVFENYNILKSTKDLILREAKIVIIKDITTKKDLMKMI